jgi:hypothetical protein
VNEFITGEVAEQLINGFVWAAQIQDVLEEANASAGRNVTALTDLAGQQYANDTLEGIRKGISGTSR